MKMRWRSWLIIAAVTVTAVISYGLVKSPFGAESAEYEFATVARGNLESTISATGTLTPVVKIEVGTQVSGTIDSLLVDFNDTVCAGQVLAVLDTTQLMASVREAEASMERTQAGLEQARYNYELNKSLSGRGLVSESDSVSTAVAYRTQLAELKSAEVALSKAKRNLDYAVVRSPISGIVIEKNIEAGQTVASSFSTPTLFVIANDLSRMEILAQVDESDIGEIKTGQAVRFEVTTHINRQFSGFVKQVRLQPETVSNVVTYTVVIEAANDDGLLLPGMTATIDFITDTRTDVLLVSAKAIKYQPTESQLEDVMAGAPAMPPPESGMRQAEAGDSTREVTSFADDRLPPPDSATMANMAVVWYLDADERLTPAMLQTGMSDGTNTEILESRELVEGMKVIAGVADSTATTTKTTRAFGGPGGPGPGGPMGL